jgi:hypothetical protein
MMQRRLVLMFAIAGIIHQSGAQTFTRITSGLVVNDGGASRSVNWVDVNNDGFPDLFVTNGLEAGEDNFLYLNNGPDSSFSFRRVTDDPIVNDGARSDGCSWADVDNDGDADAFVVNWYGDDNLSYRNNGDGTFVQVFGDVSVSGGGYSETCSWGDYDNDGDVDLYVTNSGHTAIGPQRNFLYTNDGNGSFQEVLAGEIVTDESYTRGASWVDYDLDGDLDMFVTNERNQPNQLYRNLLHEDGIAAFERITQGAIVTDIASSWSGSWGDYDNDGDDDLFVANGWPYAQNDYLYTNNGDGTFERVLNGPVVTDAAFSACGSWGDYDNDGDLDLFVTTAYAAVPTSNFLYRNTLMETGSPAFERIIDGDIVNDTGFSYGCAWEDYDLDGFLDLAVARTQDENQDNLLYRNDAVSSNHWIKLRCQGTISNRLAIGTRVRLLAMVGGQPVWQSRTLAGQTGYCGQSLTLHFGLGGALSADSLIIEWPSGVIDRVAGVPVDTTIAFLEGQTVDVEEPAGTFPSRVKLYQNYPNPFNPATTIRYDVMKKGPVRLELFDLLGRQISVPVDGVQEAGSYTVRLTSRSFPSSGVYFYVLMAEGSAAARQLMFLK